MEGVDEGNPSLECFLFFPSLTYIYLVRYIV